MEGACPSSSRSSRVSVCIRPSVRLPNWSAAAGTATCHLATSMRSLELRAFAFPHESLVGPPALSVTSLSSSIFYSCIEFSCVVLAKKKNKSFKASVYGVSACKERGTLWGTCACMSSSKKRGCSEELLYLVGDAVCPNLCTPRGPIALNMMASITATNVALFERYLFFAIHKA